MEKLMFGRTLLQLIIVLSFVACGAREQRTTARKRITLSPEMMETIVGHQNLICTEDDCPEGIGRVFAINFNDAEESSMCTGFLVGPDLVMTNSHCVYAGRITLDQTCEGLYFTFKSHYGFPYQARCEEILWRDPNQNGDGYFRPGNQDFALVKLDRSLPLLPLEVDRTGLQNWTRVYPMVVDHIDAFNARIVKLECWTQQIVNEGFAKLSECPAISGNSGAPVLDEQDRVVGLLFASENPKDKEPSTPLKERKESSNVAYAFSLDHITRILGNLF